MKKYTLHPHGAIFHQDFDQLNNFSIPVYTPETAQIITVKEEGYAILKALETSFLSLEELCHVISQSHSQSTPESIQRFLSFMETHGVVVVYNDESSL